MPNDELEIVKQARAAAERATKLIPREAWDAARRVGEVGDRLRLVPQQVIGRFTEQVQQMNQRINEMVRSLMRPALEVNADVRIHTVRHPQSNSAVSRQRNGHGFRHEAFVKPLKLFRR